MPALIKCIHALQINQTPIAIIGIKANQMDIIEGFLRRICTDEGKTLGFRIYNPRDVNASISVQIVSQNID